MHPNISTVIYTLGLNRNQVFKHIINILGKKKTLYKSMLAALIFQPHLLPAGSKLNFCPHNNVTTSYTIVGKENVTDAIRRAASSSQCVQGGNAAPRRRSSGRASLLRLAEEQGPNGGRGGSLEHQSF